MKSILRTLLIFILVSITSPAQDLSPETVFTKINQQYDSINDYQIKARISVDIPNLRMPEKKIYFYYKKPDKYKTWSSGFAMVPKNGVLPTTLMINPDSMRLTIISENDSGLIEPQAKPTTIEDSALVIEIRINPQRWTIEQINAGSSSDFQSQARFYYSQIQGYWVPDSTVIHMKFSKGLPDANRPNIHYPFGKFNFSDSYNVENQSGTIKIIFEKYDINKGLKDSVFEDN